MRAKRLVLKKDTLAELSTDSLRAVNGAASDTWCVPCLNDISFEWCPTLPLDECTSAVTRITE